MHKVVLVDSSSDDEAEHFTRRKSLKKLESSGGANTLMYIVLAVLTCSLLIALFTNIFHKYVFKEDQREVIAALQAILDDFQQSNKVTPPREIIPTPQLSAIDSPAQESHAVKSNSKTFEDVLELVAKHESWTTDEMHLHKTEGTSDGFREEQSAYFDAIQERAQARSGSDVLFCEIGFNVGHSAVLALESHPTVKYNGYSLDMKISRTVLDYLKEKYPGRVEVTFGDSVKTMHNITRVDCDILVVDGGHFFPQAQADLRNMKRFARSDASRLFIDDATCLAHWCKGPTGAWRQAIEDGFVVQERCYKMNSSHGFCQGNYKTAVNPTRPLEIWDKEGYPNAPTL